MKLVNLAAEPTEKLYSWLPAGLGAEKVVFFPDACPGRSPLPTGTATLLRRADWRRFAVSDCGCGMRLVRSARDAVELTPERWNAVAETLRLNKGGLGDLGGGNHFLDALEPYSNSRLHFLIHTGSRSESSLVDDLVDQPARFDAEFARIVDWARRNREAVQAAVKREFGPLELVLDLPHNTYEMQRDGSVIVRNGAVAIEAGELNVIPSHLSGDVALVRATARVSEVLGSMSHGTGRIVPRSDSKRLAVEYDFGELRRRVLLPVGLDDASLRTEGPYAYRDLDACLALISGFVEPVERFGVIGYMGHL